MFILNETQEKTVYIANQELMKIAEDTWQPFRGERLALLNLLLIQQFGFQ